MQGLLWRLEELDQGPVRSQVKARPRTGAITKYRHIRRASCLGLGEFAAQCRLHESAQRIASPPRRRFCRRQQLVVDRDGGAHVISI